MTPSVLLVNKFFYPRAGAETAFFHTRDVLKASGHEVIDFAMADPQNVPSPYSPWFAPHRAYTGGGLAPRRVTDAASAVYSRSARKALAQLLDERQPDVAHLHNIYHQLTLSVVDELAGRGVPTVLTLHDWKIACPAYTLFRDGAPCRECVSGSVLNVVKHRCIKGSLPGSTLAALEAQLATLRKSYQRIDRFIAPSDFAADVARMAGIPDESIHVVPYLMPEAEISPISSEPRPEPTFFFGGRLEETKGVRQMLDAFRKVEGPAALRIAGWGDLEEEVRRHAQQDPRIAFLGSITRAQVLDELSAARALLLPSTWEDNCPLIMLEAQARSTPVIASNRGGPPQFVRHGVDGVIVDPDDQENLVRAIEQLADDPATAASMGSSGRRRLADVHNSRRHYELLLGVYARAQAA